MSNRLNENGNNSTSHITQHESKTAVGSASEKRQYDSAKDRFSHKERDRDAQQDKQGKHTTFLGNALRIGLTVAAFLLIGPMVGILMGCAAFLDYKLDGSLSEKGKEIAVGLSKNIKKAVSNLREYTKEPMQVPREHAAESQSTQERQEAGERESGKTGMYEGIQPSKEISGLYTTRETQRRNNIDTEGLKR